MSWYLYVIECADGSLYTGITNDVPARFAAHVAGKGARYTRGRPPRRLLAVSPWPDRASASRAEHAVKRLSTARKRDFCSANPPPAELLAACAGAAATTPPA